MIPVRLTIQGIYSYQKEQTIDFTRLTAAGLFGIFGHVGSGKSTILEAMSFALFNKIDRLSGDRRNYNMMNLKSDRLYIDFEFMVNGKRYRIEVTGRRNRKNFSDVPTFKRGFYCLIGDIWIPMGDATAEAVTGLSYDNFHRTIIIPQGRFQEFLHLNIKERVTMLKELFGLNKYDLYDKTIILERENNEKLHNLEGRLLQIGETKPEDIA
ncbi:MAG: SMC family ATPase, partial [Bacteroidales bacterium]